MDSLTEKFKEWTDIDSAMHILALYLGLVDESKGSFQVDFKWIYHSNNIYGNTLYKMLMTLVELGLFEYDDEEQRIKTNINFDVNSSK